MKTPKVTALLAFTLATGAAVFAFGGCSVTNGTINDTEGGSGSTSGGSSGSSGNTDQDSSTPTDSSTALCPDNRQKSGDIVSTSCQSCLETNCCNELKGCFNIVVTAGDGGVVPYDCDQYSDCVAKCQSDTDPATCFEECDAVTTPEIVTAYDALFSQTGCAATNATCKTACGL